MDQSELTKLYERLYFHELDRREKIAARQATPLGALVGIVAMVAFLLNNSPVFSDPYLAALFWCVLVTAVASLLIGGWHFRKSWLAHNERHVATAGEIDSYFRKLEAHYSGQPDAADSLRRDFSQFLLDTYRRSATTNAENNDARSNSLHYAGTWLTVSLCLVLASTIPYYLGRDASHVGQKASTTASSSAPATP